MRKLIITSATLGILAIGGIANANADGRNNYGRYETGTTIYRGYDQPVYEGRNVYVDEPAVIVQPRPMYRTLGPSYGNQPSYADPWYMPGDAAIVNQERANKRSTR
jgi:hypothetical protein